MYLGSIIKVSVGLAVLVLLAGCRSGPPREPAIAQAFVGPALLNVRSEIPLDSKIVATVKHGARVDILQRHRIFLRIRTASGAVGWVSENQLLSSSDMAKLNELAERAEKMPPQGIAATYADLNVHTQPNAHAPSFVVLHGGEKFTVLGHVIAPRTDLQRGELIPKRPKKTLAKKPVKEPRYPPLVVPKPPGAPPDWLAISKTELSPDEEADEAADVKPVPTDNWSLIRTSTGQTGWVLTRRLYMAIPDEVAQYAEGHRIVSYFQLGYVQDEDQKKPIWLWTTMSSSGQPYDFDSFRVFIWSLKRHRYETAYIDRKVKGYAPVLLKEVDYGTKGRSAEPARYPGFSICEENSDGQRVRREFALLGNVVRFAGEVPCEAAAPLEIADAHSNGMKALAPEAPAVQRPGVMQRFKSKVRGIARRWFGH